MPGFEKFLQLACSKGLILDGVAPCDFAGKGLGIVAERNLKAGHVLMSVPTGLLRTDRTAPATLHNSVDGISVQGLLATDLFSDKSKFCLGWKGTMPSKEAMVEAIPFWWDPMLQELLPEAAAKLLDKQKQKLRSDWKLVSEKVQKIPYEDFVYHWFLVGTRTFYYTHPEVEEEQDPNECLALVPIADYFNHADDGCEVTFSPTYYSYSTDRKIKKGQEVFISYGNHSNDFLIAEYGFCLERNKWDEIPLDSVLSTLFNDEHRKVLESANYWGGFVLDAKSVCYRTEVALRLLCMPPELWRTSLETGFDDGDKYQKTADGILLEILKTYSRTVCQKIEQVSMLHPRSAYGKIVLNKRWKQILHLVNAALARLSYAEPAHAAHNIE